VVPSYLVRQLGVPVVEFVAVFLRNREIDTLTRLIFAIDDLLIERTLRFDRLGSLASLLVWLELRPIDSTGSKHFVIVFSLFAVVLLLLLRL